MNQLDTILNLLSKKDINNADNILQEELSKQIDDKELKDKYVKLSNFIAERKLKNDGLRLDVFFYLIGALEYYKNKNNDEIKKSCF